MSYDLRVAVKVEGCDKYADIAEPEYASPTYNLGKMFRACMDWDYEQGKYYRCDKVIPKIEHGIKELTENKGKYEKYLPANGWGTISNAINALYSLKVCIYEQAEEIPLNCLYMCW
nr:hypothetical protein [Clostridia bacterium]